MRETPCPQQDLRLPLQWGRAHTSGPWHATAARCAGSRQQPFKSVKLCNTAHPSVHRGVRSAAVVAGMPEKKSDGALDRARQESSGSCNSAPWPPEAHRARRRVFRRFSRCGPRPTPAGSRCRRAGHAFRHGPPGILMPCIPLARPATRTRPSLAATGAKAIPSRPQCSSSPACHLGRKRACKFCNGEGNFARAAAGGEAPLEATNSPDDAGAFP